MTTIDTSHLPKYGDPAFDPMACHFLEQMAKHAPNKRKPWPSQRAFDLGQMLLTQPAYEVAVVKDGRMLAQYRMFSEWAKYNTADRKYDLPGWYIPGGFLGRDDDSTTECLYHIKKDLEGEYKRAGIKGVDLDAIKLGRPVCLGEQKWEPHIHPVGTPVSNVMVCELEEGEIPETEWLRWTNMVRSSTVPYHQGFQEMVFWWLGSPREPQDWLRSMQELSGLTDEYLKATGLR